MRKPLPMPPIRDSREIPGQGLAHDGANQSRKYTADLNGQHPRWHHSHSETEGNDDRRKTTGLGARIKAEIKGAVEFTVKITVRITITISITIGVTGVASNNKQVEALWIHAKKSEYVPPVIVNLVDSVHGWTAPIFGVPPIVRPPPGPPIHIPSPTPSAPFNMGPMNYYTDRFGGDYTDFSLNSPEACQQICSEDQRCHAFSFALDMRHCWLKDSVTPLRSSRTLVSGLKSSASNTSHSGGAPEDQPPTTITRPVAEKSFCMSLRSTWAKNPSFFESVPQQMAENHCDYWGITAP